MVTIGIALITASIVYAIALYLLFGITIDPKELYNIDLKQPRVIIRACLHCALHLITLRLANIVCLAGIVLILIAKDAARIDSPLKGLVIVLLSFSPDVAVIFLRLVRGNFGNRTVTQNT